MKRALSCSFINLLCQSFATPPPPQWESTTQIDIQRQLLSPLLMRHSGPGQWERRRGEVGRSTMNLNTHHFSLLSSRDKSVYRKIVVQIFKYSWIKMSTGCQFLQNMEENLLEQWRENSLLFLSFHAIKSANLICRSNRAALTDCFVRTFKE